MDEKLCSSPANNAPQEEASRSGSMLEGSFGLVKTSLIDYPGRISAVIFSSGCTMRCPYCHNPEFVSGSPPRDGVSAGDILSFLKKRKSVLGGVCISGGEPLLYPQIGTLILAIKELGFAVKIDTNGSLPGILSDVCERVRPDFIAMDFKTAPAKYGLLTATKKNATQLADSVMESAAYIISSGIPHEFRITAVPGIVDIDDVGTICSILKGGSRIVIAGFRPGHTLDPRFETLDPYPLSVLYTMKDTAESFGLSCTVRENR